MLNTVKGIVREGKIEVLEDVNLKEGTKILITLLPQDDDFWLYASETSLDAIWDNTEDDIYAELLQS